MTIIDLALYPNVIGIINLWNPGTGIAMGNIYEYNSRVYLYDSYNYPTDMNRFPLEECKLIGEFIRVNGTVTRSLLLGGNSGTPPTQTNDHQVEHQVGDLNGIQLQPNHVQQPIKEESITHMVKTNKVIMYNDDAKFLSNIDEVDRLTGELSIVNERNTDLMIINNANEAIIRETQGQLNTARNELDSNKEYRDFLNNFTNNATNIYNTILTELNELDNCMTVGQDGNLTVVPTSLLTNICNKVDRYHGEVKAIKTSSGYKTYQELEDISENP